MRRVALVHVEVAVRAVEETSTPAPPPTAMMASGLRGRRARPKWAWISAWIESAVLAGLVPLAGAWVSRGDPLFVHAAFPWSAIAPLIAGVRYGIADAPTHPFQLSPAAGGLLEFPLATWDAYGTRWPVAGGTYFRLLPLSLLF